MKQSHLLTPRTLAECQFTTGYESAHKPQTSYSGTWWVAVSLCIAATVVVIAFTSGSPA